MRLGVLATTALGNNAVEDALRRSQIPPVQLDRGDGNIGADRELTLHGAQPIDPGHRRTDIADVGVHRGDAKDHVDRIDGPPPPRLAVDTRADPSVIPIPGVDGTIAGLRPAFRRCYEQGLAKDGPMSGSLLVRAKIRPNGEVERTTLLKNEGLTNDVAQCVMHKLDLAQFQPPKADGALLDVPVKFQYQR
jgi:hypothetical protein